MNKLEDLKTFSQIGKVLWVDTDHAQRAALETWSAVSLLELSEEKKLSRAAEALLQRFSRERSGVGAARGHVFDQPFFRLSGEQRFLLVAEHLGRWSYVRLAEILKCDAARVEELLWSARVQLGVDAFQFYVSAPSAAGSASCPSYDARKPWTQRFLDDEIPAGRERVFLTQHLMACASCQAALNRCRDLYFMTEGEVSRFAQVEENEKLNQVEELNYSRKYRSEITFRESLVIFSRRQDVQIAAILGVTLVLFKIFIR